MRRQLHPPVDTGVFFWRCFFLGCFFHLPFTQGPAPPLSLRAASNTQGSTLDKHKLTLQLSQRKPSKEAAAAARGAAGSKGKAGGTAEAAPTKLVVRNVAFEATRRDITGLFGPFGHVKSCRLPKKFDGQHRGFAFVEFVTPREARAALEGVTGTHLYGRRLVVEVAEGEEGLTEIRAKTAAKYGRQRETGDDDEAGEGAGDGGAKRFKKL